jgi:hypothetical protein
MDEWTDGQTNKRMDGQMESGWMDGWMDEGMDSYIADPTSAVLGSGPSKATLE